MALDFLLKINGRTLTDLGLDQIAPAPTFDFAGVDRETYGVPQRLGRIASKIGVGQTRVIPVHVAFPPGSDIDTRQSTLDSALRWLDGLMDIEFGHATDRTYWARLDRVPVRVRFEQMYKFTGDLVLTLDFQIDRGTAVGKTLRTLALSTTYTDVLNLGDAPSAPLVVMRGPATDPNLTYADPFETALSQVATVGEIAAGTWWEFDCENDRIIEGTDATSVRTDVTADVYSAGSFPIFDRQDGSEFLPPLIKSSHAAVAFYKEEWR